MKIRIFFAISIFVLLLPAKSIKAGNIINTGDYPYWRQLASNSPFFANMKASAIKTANTGTETRDVMGGCALAYILDPENKSKYIENIKAKFETRITDMTIGKGAATSSVPSHELFFALLALDVVRYDLKPATLQSYESILKSKIMQLVIGQWDPHAWAMRMLWYKYIGDEQNFQVAKVAWEKGLSEHYLPNDGVSPAGNGYSVQRWNSVERSAKNTTADIMEYMGYHEYYNNPGIIGLHEWIFGYANAPFGRILLYGDSRDTEGQTSWTIEGNEIISPTIIKAARFSPEAYKYAMWVLREGANVSKGTIGTKGFLSNYLIMAGTAANSNPIEFNTDDAVLAPSRLFKNYAALITHEQSSNALYLSMLNLTGNTEYHTHYETNALAMAGYGEILLRNAGYDGPGNDVTIDGVTATAQFMHSNSESSNTLMVANKSHTSQIGDGIIEGLVGKDIEYVRGSSSTAIAGKHFRDLVFVQPSNGVNGYFLVMDHVNTNKAGDNVNVVWHPNASILNTIEDKTKYFSEIKIEKGAKGPRLFSKNNATLTTFLGTTPSSVEIKRTANQSRSGYGYAADYIYANYNSVGNKADILSILFPADKTHKVANMTRIIVEGYSGSKIVQGTVQDVALVSGGSSVGQQEGKSFQGENILFRTDAGKFVSYFVKGLSFDNGESMRCGFKADESVALYMNSSSVKSGMNGMITSKGTSVTFYYPEISSVKINGKMAEMNSAGKNWMQIQIPSGTFTVDIISAYTM